MLHDQDPQRVRREARAPDGALSPDPVRAGWQAAGQPFEPRARLIAGLQPRGAPAIQVDRSVHGQVAERDDDPPRGQEREPEPVDVPAAAGALATQPPGVTVLADAQVSGASGT